MLWKETIFLTVGGLGLFLIGMGMMSDGLKNTAGRKLRKILESMTKKPIVGFLMGAAVTSLVQSSSATTVMVIGLVNAGLLTLRQAICVVFGTNVGTTITAWIVSLTGLEFKITTYAFPAVMVGFLFKVLGKSRKTKSIGQIIVGFSILFIGISIMQEAFSGLSEHQAVVDLLKQLSGQPILVLFVGMTLTMLIQSSSAAIAIIQVMASSGTFGDDWIAVLGIAIPFLLGSDIGTTITAQIASIRTNVSAKRTAWAHTMFNVIGSAIALPFVYTGLFLSVVYRISSAWWALGPMTIMFYIAVANTLFKLSCSAIFLPLAGFIEQLVKIIVRAKPSEIALRTVTLDELLLNTPEIAIDQVRREIVQMGQTAREAVNHAIDGLITDNRTKLSMAQKKEDVTDHFQYEITSYVAALSTKVISKEISSELPVCLHTINDLERIADHAVNIAEIAERKISQKLTFSNEAQSEVAFLKVEANQMFERIIEALAKNNKRSAILALSNEAAINRMQIDYRRNHVNRMSNNLCSPHVGLIFIDLVDNVEKIGDHLTNIAQSVIGGLQWAGVDSNSLSGEYESIIDT
jgi:phosphate:Na+ symporter